MVLLYNEAILIGERKIAPVQNKAIIKGYFKLVIRTNIMDFLKIVQYGLLFHKSLQAPRNNTTYITILRHYNFLLIGNSCKKVYARKKICLEEKKCKKGI